MRRARPILALVASGVLLLLAFRDVDLRLVTSFALSARLELLLLAVALDVAVFVAKSLKWRAILMPIQRLPLSSLLSAIAVGALAGTVVPLRLDEVIRAAYLGHRTGVAKAAVLGSILIERIVDLSSLLVAVGLVLAVSGAPVWFVRGAGLALAALVGAALLVVLLLGGRGRPFAAAGRLVPTRLGALVVRGGEDFVRGVALFPRGRRLALVVALAAAEWCVTLVHMRAVLGAFGLEVPLVGTLSLVAAVYMSFALPSGPGGLGLFELLVKGALVGGFAVGANAALGFALTLHLLLVAPISLIGAACLAREGVSLSSLRRSAPDASGRAAVGDHEGHDTRA